MDGYGICPECTRNEELAARQAGEMERVQRQVQEEAHLNEIKRKLLDLAIEALDDPNGAAKKVEVVMHSSDFRDNLNWFWNDVAGNTFLLNVCCSMTLAPLISGSASGDESVSFLDGLDSNVRSVAGQWLSDQPADSAWRKVALVTFRGYERVLQQRKQQQQKEAEEYSKRSAREQAARDKQRAKESAAQERKDKRLKTIRVAAATVSSVTFLAGVLFGGSIKLPLWINAGTYTSVGAFCVLGILLLRQAYIASKEYITYTSGTLFGDVEFGKWFLYWCSAIFALYLTSRCWSQIEGPARIAAITAAFGVPFIPLIRGAIGSFAVGIACGLISLPVAYVAGVAFSGFFAWIMTSGH